MAYFVFRTWRLSASWRWYSFTSQTGVMSGLPNLTTAAASALSSGCSWLSTSCIDIQHIDKHTDDPPWSSNHSDNTLLFKARPAYHSFDFLFACLATLTYLKKLQKHEAEQIRANKLQLQFLKDLKLLSLNDCNNVHSKILGNNWNCSHYFHLVPQFAWLVHYLNIHWDIEVKLLEQL